MIKPIVFEPKPKYDFIENGKKYFLLVFTRSETCKYLVEVKEIGDKYLTIKLNILKSFTKNRAKSKLINRLVENHDILITDDDNLQNIQKEFYLSIRYYPNTRLISSLSDILSRTDISEYENAITQHLFRHYNNLRNSAGEGSEIKYKGVGALLLSYSEDLHNKLKSRAESAISASMNSDVAKHTRGFIGGNRRRRRRRTNKKPRKHCATSKKYN